MKVIPPIYLEIDASHRIRISVIEDKVHFIKERKYPAPGHPTNFEELVNWDTEYKYSHPTYYEQYYGDEGAVEKTIPLAWVVKLLKLVDLF
jgi:hypothetical protein